MKSERLKKLEADLEDLDQWMSLGLVPKKDVEKFRFVVIGTPRHYDQTTWELVDEVAKEKPDFIIGTGNYVYTPKRAHAWEEHFIFFRRLFRNVPFIPTAGNNDISGDKGKRFTEHYVLPGDELNYSFTWGKCRFISPQVNRNVNCRPNTDQHPWLEKELEKAKDADFVFMVHNLPIYSMSGKARDGMMKRATRLLPIFLRHEVDVSLAGNDHSYQRWKTDDVVYIVSGGFSGSVSLIDIAAKNKWKKAGFLKRAENAPHYVLVEVDSDKVTFTAKGLEGEIIDKFELSKKSRRPREEGKRKGGKRDGVWTTYYSSGKKLVEITYKDGVKDGRYTCWYSTGQKWEEGTYVNGKVDGKWTMWFRNGVVGEDSNYKEGKLHGEQFNYFHSGKKMELIIYKNGLPDGTWIDWDRDGKVKGTYKFKDGKPVRN